MLRTRFDLHVVSVRVLVVVMTCNLFGQTSGKNPADGPGIVQLQRLTSVRHLPSGIEAKSGAAAVRIIALRDDIVRVQVSRNGVFPPNHSWSVLPDVITHSVVVKALTDTANPGFETSFLRVQVGRDTARIVILDLMGNVLSKDYGSRPTAFFGNEFKVYKTAFPDEHFYGLGDKPGDLDRRNRSFQMWNTDAYGWEESRDPLYKSIPFFLALRNDGRSYGLLLDNTFRSSFDFTTELRDAISFGAEGGDLDYYFIYGPEPKQVLFHFADLVGHAPLPPRWAFGFQQSRDSYKSGDRVREVTRLFRQKRIPVDVIYLDIAYQIKNRPFTINTEQFPTFKKMITDLAGDGIHTVAITDPHIAQVPNAGYAPYESGLAGDHFVHNPDGSLFVGEVWPGPSVFPEFTRESSREWWGNLYKDLYVDQGVAGFWNDMNEPMIFGRPTATMPLDTPHRIEEPGQPSRTTTHREIHNVFGMENSRATYEGLVNLKPNLRPFVLTRASFAGGQRYAITWTGDNSSTWNHLRLSTPQLLNLGLSGFSFAGDDIGGYRGSPMPELLTRWIELGVFNPIYRDHTEEGTADQEPWVHGPEQEAIRKRYIELRYQLMPYIYTVAEEASRTGLPMMRPVFLEFPKEQDRRVTWMQQDGEFFFGPALLIAPQPSELLDSYEVGLPKGEWYDYWSGQPVPSASSVKIEPKLDKLPVFVRAGSIIPQQGVVQSTSETPKGPLEVRLYPGPNCAGSLYTDDGSTFDYKRGAYLRESFSCEVTASEIRIHIAPHEGRFEPWWKQLQLEIVGYDKPPKQLRVNGVITETSFLEIRSGETYMTIDDPADGSEVEIQY